MRFRIKIKAIPESRKLIESIAELSFVRTCLLLGSFGTAMQLRAIFESLLFLQAFAYHKIKNMIREKDKSKKLNFKETSCFGAKNGSSVLFKRFSTGDGYSWREKV